MRIVVTGAGGMLGVHFQALAVRHQLLRLSHGELDVCDAGAVMAAVDDLRPEALINCATLGVDRCEKDPELARDLNARAPAILAEACARAGAQLVHFSTNYVFAGDRDDGAPYSIHDRPDPISSYGRTKVEGELAVRELCRDSHVVRTSWVYGPQRENFLGTIHCRLRAGERVPAIADAWASTTFAPDLVAQVERLLVQRSFGLHHVVNAGICSRYDVAREAGRLLGLSDDETRALIDVVNEAGAGQQAPRPRWSPLEISTTSSVPLAPMRDWPLAFREHVSAKL